MAFYPWVDDANLSGNVMADATYEADSQRESGFQAGVAASAIRVNTALRQATLVTAALMNAMGLSTYSLQDSQSDIETALGDFFSDLDVEANPDMTGQTPIALSGLKVKGSYYTVSGGGTTVVANPTLSGTEADLGGLTVGGTKYKVFKQISGTFKYSLGGVEVSGGKYILQGNKLSLYFNGNFSSYSAVSGTQLTLIDESGNWNKFNTSDSQNKILIGTAGGTTMYFGSAAITHSSLSPYIVLAFDNIKIIAGSTIGDGTFSGYYMQYFVNTVVDFIL